MSKPNILFVDDEIRIVRSLDVLFSTQNQFNVHTATSGQDAIEIVKKFPTHVVVSDQRMPGVTGVDLLKSIKESSPNTVGILLTGYADLDAIVSSINEGEIFRYITKPWNNQILKEKVQNALSIAEKLFAVDNIPNVRDQDAVSTQQHILVLHPEQDDNIAMLTSKLFGDNNLVHYAHDIETAVDKMTKDNISVIITDIGKNNKNYGILIKMLKQAYPLALTIVVTDSADANTAISLINQGQVYRYLPKPIQPGRFKLSIASALSYYAKIRQAPVLMERHSVESLSANEEITIPSGFKNRVLSLRNRLMTMGR